MVQQIKALRSAAGDAGVSIQDSFPILVSDEMEILEWPLLYLLHIGTIRGRSRSWDTIRTYAEHLVDFFDTLEQNGVDWRHATLDIVAAYRDRMAGQISPHTGRTYAASTVNARLRTVERFYQFAHRQGWIARVPFAYEDVSTDSARRDTMLAHVDAGPSQTTASQLTLRQPGSEIPCPVPTDTLRRFFAAAERPYDLIAAWMVTTGMRAEEVAALTPAMIPDMSGPVSDDLSAIPLTITKGSKPRRAFPPKRLLIWTDRYVAEERTRTIKQARQRNRAYTAPGHLFLTKTGKPVYKRRIIEEISKTFTRVGAPEVTSHWLRHTYAMTMLTNLQRQAATNGDLNPLVVLRDLLGHESIQTTSKYLNAVQIYSDDLHQSVEGVFERVLGQNLDA
jgi:site-specific recombinase XerD